ncbi:hypothetical protein CBR_g34527 [Chara braunii]|uniref:Uncharacterized protein n=1 Tax=Chara braunii TaxID=69332 RepID=A0A388LIU0_CHABU|nr:hypothetical protein CBR_g34527 [Chara braunii]|eukprot:GBG82244.1 hypothetical protein CBR_g34527 [Chara braunii]
MQDFIEMQNQKKEEKALREQKRNELLEQEEAERMRLEAKEARAAKKARKRAEERRVAAEAENERRAQMKKNVNISVAVKINELEDNWFQRLHRVIGPLYKTVGDKGKKKVTYVSDHGSRSERKTPKTPKAAQVGVKEVRACTPVTRGTLERLRYRNKVIDDLKSLDMVELQKLCKGEGISYNGKIKSILDIADKRAMVKFGATCQEFAEVIRLDDSEALDAGSVDGELPEDASA